MITSVISLLRSNRASGIQTSHRAQLNLLAGISDGNPPTVPSSTPADTAAPYQPDTPLAATDFAALFNISPYLLVQSHVASVERLYAIPEPSDESSEGEGSSDEESGDADDEKVEVTDLDTDVTLVEKEGTPGTRSTLGLKGVSKRLPGRARSSSTAVASSATTMTGRDKYLIDPSVVFFPWGAFPSLLSCVAHVPCVFHSWRSSIKAS